MNMKNLDDQIRQSLSSTDAQLLGAPEDGQRFDQLLISTFHTRNKFITMIAFIYSFAFFGLAVWCGFRFFGAEETKSLLAWGFGFMTCIFAMSMLKMWFWLEMQRISITREVKRVELLSARLLQEMSKASE